MTVRYDKIRQRLRQARKRAGLSQSDVTQRLNGVSSNTMVSRWENGSRNLDLKTFVHLIRLYDAEPCWIINGELCQTSRFVCAQCGVEVSGEQANYTIDITGTVFCGVQCGIELGLIDVTSQTVYRSGA